MTLKTGSSASAIERLQEARFLERLWSKDPGLWKGPSLLGWTDIASVMLEKVPELDSFSREVRKEFSHVVLLGMGGSSLAPEVFRAFFPQQKGFPRLWVLDTTDPDWIAHVLKSVEPEKTFFIVSSKSGSTVEPNCLFSWFYDRIQEPSQFCAITDPESSLESLAKKTNFRKIFLNPPDIGGRYSALSYFGLVPASLIGAPAASLLERAAKVRERREDSQKALELGAELYERGRQNHGRVAIRLEKSRLVMGLWLEQLIAESTGKEGKGIVPVIGTQNDDAVNADIEDPLELGAEFLKWETAVAAAGYLLDINPFDQPDVESAKQKAKALLKSPGGKGPAAEEETLPRKLLQSAAPGDYFCILAYLPYHEEVKSALDRLRLEIQKKLGPDIPVLWSYGPRYLHSTGQLHKGGPNSGIFLILTADPVQDLSIPGQSFSFAQLERAQALGDLQALKAAGRRAIRFHLKKPDAESIQSLQEAIL